MSRLSQRQCWAVLCAGRPGRRHRLAAMFDRWPMTLELDAGSATLLAGAWQTHVTVDDTAVVWQAPAEVTCWFQDDDLDYAEIRYMGSGGVRLERHMLLSRSGNFAVLADAVLAERLRRSRASGRSREPRATSERRTMPSKPSRLEYAAALPLAPRVRAMMEKRVRRGTLRTGGAAAHVLSPALPQLRSEPADGSLRALPQAPGALTKAGVSDGGVLEFRRYGTGRALFAPLWLDLDPALRPSETQWRSLTVTQLARRRVADDIAVGYRIRRGGGQWLLYRSLGPRAVRAVLGHQTRYQFVFAEFDWSGNVKPLIEIV